MPHPAGPDIIAPAPGSPRPFTAPELEAAWWEWSGYSPTLADVLLMLARTGLRWGEARVLTVADVQSDCIVVDKAAAEGGPTRRLPVARVREVPLAPRVRPIVWRLAAGRDADELLLTTSLGAPLRRASVLRRLNWSQTGDGRGLHDLRDTAAYLWLTEGVAPSTVRAWMGPTRIAA